ncbi:MAG TPA: prepilin-type N-terminal cleavage/methylation domain-containing protein [Pirellulales bacterium]|jgi:prepilin-type N-terminal cleavage/methylation domain-containing protein|nr:prepilin-type N-terminal cleavage/methylation domain-containing protein [Pirellulales bacterium]
MRNRISNRIQLRLRRGLTLVELMISIMILSVTVVALVMMFRAVEISSEYSQGYGTATQHARVTLDRLDRAINQAYANVSYCGAWIVSTTIGSYTFPDTLVVWRPASGTPANSSGAPLASELDIFCPDPAAANQLVEITVPNDTSTMPSPSNAATFKSYISGLKTESGVNKVQLTNLLHTTAVTGSSQTFGAVRFVVQLSPSDASYSSYQSGSTTFQNLPWAQSMCSPSTGLRQVWVRTELQLIPYGQWLVTNAVAEQAVPFFGSCAYYYEMTP